VQAPLAVDDASGVEQSLDLKELAVMHLHRWISTFAFLAVTMPVTIVGQSSQTVSRAEARKVIQDGNIEWGKARIAIDKNTFEKMLAPDLYIQLSDRRLTRQQFIDRISSYPPGNVNTIRCQCPHGRTERR
jgi:hypothetical protein